MRQFAMEQGAETRIEVRAGETFQLILEANISTGYSWRLEGPLDPQRLELLASAEEEAPPQRLGAPQRQIWTLRAACTGPAEIAFAYCRPWEKEAPLRRHRIVMTIR